MEKYQKKIDEVLTQALTEKTFSLEIIEKIKSLKDGFESNLKLTDELNNRIDFYVKQITEKDKTIEEQQVKIKSFMEREDKIIEAEKTANKNKYELEFQKKRADEIKEIMGIVFKNPIVRETAYKNYSDYGSGKSENSSVEKTAE